MTGRPFRPRSRAGYMTTVITPWGRETYQVWLEEDPSGWTARIRTLPNRIWAVSGGREALKFRGSTAEEADAAAAGFIEQERLATMRRVASPSVGAPLLRSSPDAPPAVLDVPAAPRIPHRLLLRFGPRIPQRPGVTANLSESGLFVITDAPGQIGSNVAIDLRFSDSPVLVGGEVVWVSTRREAGRSLGFGVKLLERPIAYVQRVRTLSQTP